MYEMQRPRPVSRHRPADCSASFAPLDRLPGAVTLTGAPVARITSGSGVPLAGWVRVFSLPTARGCPHAGAAKFLFAGGSECRLWPVARGFPFAGWLGASSHLRPEISPCRVASGPPRPVARGVPLPVAPGPLKPVDLRCPVAGWLRISPGPKARRYPLPGGSGLAPRRWPRVSSVPTAPGFPCARGREEIPLPGGSRKPSNQWPEALPLPVGSGVSPFASGLGFPLRRLPFPVVKKFLRLFVRGAQEVCTSNFKILWPSTSHPQLTPGCPPRQTFLHRILHSAVHRPAGSGFGIGRAGRPRDGTWRLAAQAPSALRGVPGRGVRGLAPGEAECSPGLVLPRLG